MPAQKEQQVVTTTTKRYGATKTVVHPDIHKAAEHAVKELGKPNKGTAGFNAVKKALEGEPLSKPIAVPHEKGDATFSPVGAP